MKFWGNTDAEDKDAIHGTHLLGTKEVFTNDQ